MPPLSSRARWRIITAARTQHLLVALLLCLAVEIGVAATPALGATITEAGAFVGYQAAPGEANNVTVSFLADSLTVTDSVPIIDGDGDDAGGGPSGCVLLTAHQAVCPATTASELLFFMEDGNDRVDISAPLTAVVCGGDGNDVLAGGPGDDGIAGGTGDDRISGGEGLDILDAGAGICGGVPNPADKDALDGGGGNDILQGGLGDDTLEGGAGDDSVFGFGGNDSLSGGDGNDALVGYQGDDSLQGGAGNDILGGGDGTDSLSGGPGDDELGRTFIYLGIVTSDNGDDVMDGGPGDDVLNGGPGATAYSFDSPVATVPQVPDVGGPNGSDVINGGDGRDTVTYVNRSSNMNLSLDGLRNDGAADEGDAIASDVERLVGGSGDDNVTGTPGDDYLDGGGGNDVVESGSGDDAVLGGPGNDQLLGRAGPDTLKGGVGNDTIDGAEGADTIDGGAGADSVEGGPDNDSVAGGSGPDILSGGTGDDNVNGGGRDLVGADSGDQLNGGDGNDTLAGDDGDDTLAGGRGIDTISGGDGHDSVDYHERGSAVNVVADDKQNDGETGEGDNVRSDVEAAIGGSGPDSISGTGAANTLRGGAGEDFLDGGPALDLLFGGAGNDVVRARDGSIDVVSCGAGFDFAIVDGTDAVKDNCELIDAGDDRPIAGRMVVVEPTSGTIGVEPRSMDRFVPLQDRVTVPIGSSIDARSGAVRVALIRRRAGIVATTLKGSLFSIQQHPSGTGPAELRLRGGPFNRCGPKVAGSQSALRSTHRIRGMSAQGNGRLRVVARNSSATGRHADWVTEDLCGGTMTRVRRGRVTVLDLTTGRKRTLAQGEHYFAKAQ